MRAEKTRIENTNGIWIPPYADPNTLSSAKEGLQCLYDIELDKEGSQFLNDIERWRGCCSVTGVATYDDGEDDGIIERQLDYTATTWHASPLDRPFFLIPFQMNLNRLKSIQASLRNRFGDFVGEGVLKAFVNEDFWPTEEECYHISWYDCKDNDWRLDNSPGGVPFVTIRADPPISVLWKVAYSLVDEWLSKVEKSLPGRPAEKARTDLPIRFSSQTRGAFEGCLRVFEINV